jgi:pilus assembly protein Flp/PilA
MIERVQMIANFLAVKFAKDERGVTMLEYSILLGIITVAAIVAIVFAGDWVGNQWNNLQTSLTNAGS